MFGVGGSRGSALICQTALVSHGRVQDRVEFFILEIFFVKKEDRPRPLLPQAARHSGRWRAPPSALGLQTAW